MRLASQVRNQTAGIALAIRRRRYSARRKRWHFEAPLVAPALTSVIDFFNCIAEELSLPETNELPCSAEEIVDDGDVDLQSASVGCGCIAVEVPDDAHAPGPLRPSVPL